MRGRRGKCWELNLIDLHQDSCCDENMVVFFLVPRTHGDNYDCPYIWLGQSQSYILTQRRMQYTGTTGHDLGCLARLYGACI